MRRKTAWSAFVLLACAIPLLSALYLYAQEGFKPESSVVLFPPGPYKADLAQPRALSAIPADMNAFLLEFSAYYFHRKSRFASLFFEELASDRKGHAPEPAPAESILAPEAPFPPAAPSASRAPGPASWSFVSRNRPLDGSPGWGAPRPMPKPHIRLKSSIRNQAFFGTRFISSLTVKVRLAERSIFPWSRLTVTPVLSATVYEATAGHEANDSYESSDGFGVVLTNNGIGPAIDAHWDLHASSGMLLKTGLIPIVDEIHQISFPEPGEDVSPRKITTQLAYPELEPRALGKYLADRLPHTKWQGDGRLLAEPLYYAIGEERAAAVPEARSFEHHGQWYEIVNTFERLSQITDAVFDEPYTLRVSYSALDGAQFHLIHTGDLPHDVCFYRRAAGLFEYDPREVRIAENRVKAATYEVEHIVESLARYFGPPAADPKGVDLLISECTLDLTSLDVQEARSTTVPVERFLNAQGALTAYILCLAPSSGRYEVTVAIDDTVVDQVVVDSLVPEVFEFPRGAVGQHEEISRLKAALAARRFAENGP